MVSKTALSVLMLAASNSAMTASPSRWLASSGSHQGVIKLWELASGTAQELLFGGAGEVHVSDVTFDRSGRYLAACAHRKVKIWDTQDRI